MNSKSFLIVLLLCLGIVAGFQQNSIKAQEPHRIMMSIPGDPATTRAVTWRSDANAGPAVAQIARATASPFFSGEVVTLEGTTSFWEEGNPSSKGNKVIFENLEPETMYMYRVGNGEMWSEWFQFTTSGNTVKPFRFLYFGDVQNDIKSLGSRTIRSAFSRFGDAAFLLFAGDLVSSSTDDYWHEFFYAGSWIFGSLPSLATPGNHEYKRETENGPIIFSKHWNQIFINPNNGPENLANHSYYIDYQGVRFISLDSPALGYSEENSVNSVKWLRKVLSENRQKWTILFTHYPVFSCSQGRDNEKYRDNLKSLLEEYGVDLVLQGHDHTYCRGQNLANIGKNCKNPPMYMVSVAGPKMYGLNVNRWSDRVASATQLYQVIDVNNNTIHVQVFTVTGELYDDFSIVKNKKGINKIIESTVVKNIPENVGIPESAKSKFTADDLKKYNSIYK